jgi:LysM repeat protein
MTTKRGRMPAKRPVQKMVDLVLSVVSGVVALGGAVAVAAALLMFLPGTNGDAGVPVAGGDEPATTTTVAPTTTTTPPAPTTTAPQAAPETTTTTTPPETTTTTVPDADVLGVQLSVPMIPYRVVRGDTLSLIGGRFGVDWEELAEINDLADPNVIGIGTVLLIPDPDASTLGVPAVLADNPERARLIGVFDRWADEYGVPAELLKAVAWHESEWDNARVGTGGEVGIGQLTPAIFEFAASELVGIPLSPAVESENIQTTAAYLGWLLDTSDGDTSASLAAYYQDLTSLRDLDWSQDTVSYISAVLALRPVFDPRAAVPPVQQG